MAISANFPDKILAGLNQSCTVTSDEGPPHARIHVDSEGLPFRLIPLGPPKDAPESSTSTMKYKVTFHVPEDAARKTLHVDLWTDASRVEETRPVVEG